MKPQAKRLTPASDVLRKLFLLSGNNCAIPECKCIIVDNSGVMIGRICHIEAAMPDGARFNSEQSNDQRRGFDNLILLCANHHAQIDDVKTKNKWTVDRLKLIKREHEDIYRGVDTTLQKAFETGYSDITNNVSPTIAKTFEKFNQIMLRAIKTEVLEDSETKKACRLQINQYIKNASKATEKERKFLLAVINRAKKLGQLSDSCSIPVTDVKSCLQISHNEMSRLGDAIKLYGVGDFDLVGKGDADVYCVNVRSPSDYVSWHDLMTFCEHAHIELASFVVHLDFQQLDR